MATVIDSLTIELGWDVKKFLEGAKETEAKVKTTREDFERTSKVWDATIGSLIRTLGGLVTAFLSVEAAIKGIEWTKGASQAGADFSNLAAAINMSTTQLNTWENALMRVGGREGEARQAFLLQQAEFQKTRGPKGGAPVFLDRLQQLGLTSFFDPKATSFDPDAFNRALFERIRGMAPEQRQQILTEFGFPGTAAQRMAGAPLGPQLAQTSKTAMTKENEETFNRLQALWTDLSNTAEAVYRDITTYLEQPLTHILESLTRILDLMRGSGAGKLLSELGRQISEESFLDFWLKPHVYDEKGKGRAVTWGEYLGWNKKPAEAGAPPAAQEPSKSSGGWSWPWSTPPAATAPPVVEQRSYSSPQGGASMPIMPPPPEPPASFEDRFAPAMGPRSSIDMSRRYAMLMDLPRSARASVATQGVGGGSVATNSQSNVTIGAMTFNSRASDTAMGHAPSDISKDLSVASYSVHANEALE
jgi:hypothetical protein